jgi:predicted PurR-regulated permease PerM
MADTPRRHIAVDIPWRTIFKVFAAAALLWLWFTLVDLVLVMIVAVLLAVTLDPVVKWLEHRGLPRWGSALAAGFAVIALLGGFLWLTYASLSTQATYLMEHFGEFERNALAKLPDWARKAAGASRPEDVQSYVSSYALRFAQSTASALVVTVLGFILTLYLLIEGRPTRDWLMAYVPAAKRPKVQQTLTECERVIFAYVAGNVITSIFATAFVLIVLSVLKVPAALLLAVLAGVCDFIPVLGFIVSSIPAILLAMTVSGTTALLVVAAYVAYHAVENYIIGPWAYGGRLRLSNVAVVLAFVVGAEIAGVIGALIALPVAAIYPSIEKIWLREALPEETVREHKAIEQRKAG